MGLFGKLKEVLRKTKESLSKKLVELFAKNKLGDEFYEELEDILISVGCQRQDCDEHRGKYQGRGYRREVQG